MKPTYGLIIAAILVIMFVGTMFAIGQREFSRKITAFHQLMAPSKIVGKTSTQVVSIYGNPAGGDMDDYPPVKGHHTMLYPGPCWEECFIDFADDKAVAVHFGSH